MTIFITYTDRLAELGRTYTQAFHDQARADGVLDKAGLPGVIYTEPDRGSVQIGRFAAIEGDPEEHFRKLGGGDVAAGARLSAAAFVHGLGFADSFLVTDLAEGNAFQASAIEAAARVVFHSAWAEAMEEAGRGAELSGRNVAEIAPETPADFLESGRYLIGLIEGLNGATVEDLYERAMEAQFPKNFGRREGTAQGTKFHPERFAECLALEAMGSGVAWTDDAAPFEIEMPSVEFALDLPDVASSPAP